MIYEAARKVLVTGLGLAVFTKEKADALIEEWVKEGELSKEEGRELLDTWMKRVDSEREEVRTRIQKEVQRMIDQAGLVSRADYQALVVRVEALEAKLGE